MDQCSPLPNLRRSLLFAACAALLLLATCIALATNKPPIARAQGTLNMAISKTLDGSPVVRVGQYITFTIRITNTGTISITSLPVIDDFDARVLRLDQTNPPPSTTGNGQITWTNLPTATLSGPLPPGATITIRTRFRVIGISNYTVNKVRVQDALGFGGQSGGSGNSSGGGKTEGGRVVVEKALTRDSALVSGRPITFTIAVRNDGAAALVKVPMQDSYPADSLQFWKSLPPATSATTGELRWDNLLPLLGMSRLQPNEVLTVTTVFTAVKSMAVDQLNSAGAAGVVDEFQNKLAAPRRAEVPIRILPAPQEATPTARPRRQPKQDRPTATPIAPAALPITPTEAVTVTAPITAGVTISPTSAAAQPTIVPAQLPRTGDSDASLGWLILAAGMLAGGLLVLLFSRFSRRT